MRRLARASFAGSNEGTGVGRGRFRRAFATLAGVGSLALVMALALVPAASADEPWGFEKVTPDDKGAGAVSAADTFDASPDGNSFLYSTMLPFDAVPTESVPFYNRYLGIRGDDGWSSHVVDPPYSIEGQGGTSANLYIMPAVRSSRDQSHAIVVSAFALTPGAIEGGSNIYVRNLHTGEFEYLIAASADRLEVQWAKGHDGQRGYRFLANDGRSAIFASVSPLLPGLSGGGLYSWTADDGLELLNRMPANQGGDVVPANLSPEGAVREPLGLIDPLSHVYMSAFADPYAGAYVRTDGETKLISYSRIPAEGETEEQKEIRLKTPVAAVVRAASDGGHFAALTTTVRLTEATPVVGGATTYLYRYDVTNDSLTYVAYGPGTFGIFQMARDGQTIAIRSNAALDGQGVGGKTNVYVWRNGSIRHVAALEAGSTMTVGPKALSLLSEDGRYFAFTDNSINLASQTAGYNNANATACPPPSSTYKVKACDQVYVYDADVVGGKLECASCNPSGELPKGRAGDPRSENTNQVRFNEHQARNIANDGTVFFTTFDDLLPLEDNNGLEDVYSYNRGNLRLVSRGTQGASSRFLDATPDGKTVFFSTNDKIYPGDVDRAVDIYMTREGAGFPYTPPVIVSDCGGIEVCHDGLSPRQSQASAGSASFQGRGNEAGEEASGEVTVTKPKAAEGATATLRVKVPGKGKLTITGNGVKKTTKSVAKAGTVTVKVSLTASGREALEKSGQAQEKVKVVFRLSAGEASNTSVTLTYKAKAGKTGGR